MAAMRLSLIAVALLLVAYAFYEFRLWRTRGAELSISPRQRRIRVIGFVLLLIAIGLWYRGTYLAVPHFLPGMDKRLFKEQAANYLGYWMVTFIVLLPLIPLALLDTRENVLQVIAERRQIREDAFGRVAGMAVEAPVDADQDASPRPPGEGPGVRDAGGEA